MDPCNGGVVILAGIFMSSGLSYLQFVSLRSFRNMFVFGVTVGVGVFLPQYVKSVVPPYTEGNQLKYCYSCIYRYVHRNCYSDAFLSFFTENYGFDRIVAVALRSDYVVGFFLGIFLDNVIPGYFLSFLCSSTSVERDITTCPSSCIDYILFNYCSSQVVF